jgi:hypothetical protein
MLRSLNEIKNYTLLARDGEIGRSKDFLFDDQHWTVRFMVADTGDWLPGKQVLVSPVSLARPDWVSGRIPVNMTKEQIEEAPMLDEHAPVSRRHEQSIYHHFGWPFYWTGPGEWGPAMIPSILAQQKRERSRPRSPEEEHETAHLRSLREVVNYQIHASDGDLGHVEDFIVDDEHWTIRYMVIDTRKWLPGRLVIIAPAWVRLVSWEEKMVSVDLTKNQIRESPPFDPSTPVNRDYEERLYDFYGRPVYWR